MGMTNSCDCIFCKQEKPFDLNDELLLAVLRGDAVVFAGAGISTESRNVLPVTFYESVAQEVNKIDSDLSFPEMMDSLSASVNGPYKLRKMIQDRFNMISSFPELYGVATRFHRELASFYFISTVVTTNWDTYFEDICKTTPFVTNEDLAFWEDVSRRVLKIHGSISNYGSIVATTKQYDDCRGKLDTGLIGSALKLLLATKTVIFIGYSLSDADFRYIYDFVRNQMKDAGKQAYVVTPNEVELDKFRDQGLIPINTSGDHFLRQLKKHSISEGLLLPDEVLQHAMHMRDVVFKEHVTLHKNVDFRRYPQSIFAAYYQDGLLHAFERCLSMWGSGEYANPHALRHQMRNYEMIANREKNALRYENIPYVEGYINALTFLLGKGEGVPVDHIPLYFAYGYKGDILDFTEFRRVLKKLRALDEGSYKYATRRISSLKADAEINLHHPPIL